MCKNKVGTQQACLQRRLALLQESSLWSAATALKQEPGPSVQPKWAHEQLGPAQRSGACHTRRQAGGRSGNGHAAAAADDDFDDDLPVRALLFWGR